MSNNPNANNTLAIINSTPANQIAALEFVKNKFIKNYNSCHKQKIGELVYARQCMFFQQAMANSADLAGCDRFSLYACFLTVSVKGWSLDPQDDEVYLIPRGGKACIDRQAGAYVRRLIETGQIMAAGQPVLVYDGDVFSVENGRVIKHIQNYATEILKCAYIEFSLPGNNTRFFIYRKSDWEAWRSRSPQKNKDNWNGPGGQPDPGFLRTKIVKHACKEKCWASGSTPAGVEIYETIEVDSEDLDDTTPASEVPFFPGANEQAAASAQNETPEETETAQQEETF